LGKPASAATTQNIGRAKKYTSFQRTCKTTHPTSSFRKAFLFEDEGNSERRTSPFHEFKIGLFDEVIHASSKSYGTGFGPDFRN